MDESEAFPVLMAVEKTYNQKRADTLTLMLIWNSPIIAEKDEKEEEKKSYKSESVKYIVCSTVRRTIACKKWD